MKKQLTFQSELAFFGLTSDNVGQYRASLFTQIHEIVFHGKGGYDWNTIYNMPVWLRRFTFNKIKEFYEKEAEESDKQSGNITNNASIPEEVKQAASKNKARSTPTYLSNKKPSIKASQ